MSSLAVRQDSRLIRSREKLPELEVTRRISQVCASAMELRQGIQDIALIALRAKGILRIEITPGEPLLSQFPEPLLLGRAVSASGLGTAVGDLTAEGKKWGSIRVFFELKPQTIENPLKFVRYVGQQMAVLLLRTGLELERESLKNKTVLLKTLIAKRKAIHRARALLRHTHNISEGEALALMRRYVRQSGRTMHQIAEAIILSDHHKWTRPVVSASPQNPVVEETASSRPGPAGHTHSAANRPGSM